MIRFRDLGRFSGPTVLLLHGSPVPAAYLDRLASTLSHTFRVLLPDLPGYGDSGGAPRPLRDVQGELERHLIELGLRSVDVVGVHLGVYRALRLALGKVVSVRRMVALSGFARLDDSERRRCLTYADIVRIGGDLCDVYLEQALSAEVRDGQPSLAERCRGWVHHVAPATWVAELEAMAQLSDLLPGVHDLSASLLVLHGDEDRVVPVAKAFEMAEAAPRAVVERLPCGHLPLFELPERVVPRIRSFLSF
jgi:3-oxoadipate enol-lactonase